MAPRAGPPRKQTRTPRKHNLASTANRARATIDAGRSRTHCRRSTLYAAARSSPFPSQLRKNRRFSGDIAATEGARGIYMSRVCTEETGLRRPGKWGPQKSPSSAPDLPCLWSYSLVRCVQPCIRRWCGPDASQVREPRVPELTQGTELARQ